MNLDMTKLSKSAGEISGDSNGVREDTLGEFLNTVFSYQSKEDIPNQLQTQANVQNLKQISRDTTAIIARYGNLDYVLQIDTLVGDSSVRGFIHGYIYNPNIKDIICISINTVNGVATFKFNTDSGGSSGGSINIYEETLNITNLISSNDYRMIYGYSNDLSTLSNIPINNILSCKILLLSSEYNMSIAFDCVIQNLDGVGLVANFLGTEDIEGEPPKPLITLITILGQEISITCNNSDTLSQYAFFDVIKIIVNYK